MPIPNEGAIQLLNYQLTSLQYAAYGLYTNNYTPTATTVFSNLTEAAFTGYSRVIAGAWSAPVIVSGRAQSYPSATITFTNGSAGSQTIYGWFLLDPGTGKLLTAEYIGATVIAAGQSYALTATATDKQE